MSNVNDVGERGSRREEQAEEEDRRGKARRDHVAVRKGRDRPRRS
jgi:hypothetical protein